MYFVTTLVWFMCEPTTMSFYITYMWFENMFYVFCNNISVVCGHICFVTCVLAPPRGRMHIYVFRDDISVVYV